MDLAVTDATAFVRARSPAHKLERRQSLLVAARAMLEEGTPLAQLSLNDLARRAGMTKSNTYRYFESREHVLLELLEDEWLGLLAALTSAPTTATATPAALSSTLTQALVLRPLLCELTTALPAVLEQNLSTDAVLAFKEKALALFTDGGVALAARAPFLSPAGAAQLLSDIAVVLGGLWPYSRPAPAVVEALALRPELCVLQKDFAKDLARFLGMLVEATRAACAAPAPA
jgi:AcrR family transcriptional regulator